MKARLYAVLMAIARSFGPWVIDVFSWFVSTGYFLFARARVANSVDFYIKWKGEGMEHLRAAASKGGILLMSHVGDWEVAARLLSQEGMRMLLFIGEKQKEQIERLHKRDMSRDGVAIKAVSPGGGSAFDLLDAVTFLREGGFVSMAGDQAWTGDPRRMAARFLGREVLLPAAPHALALASSAPLFTFFAFRIGRGRYRFKADAPRFVVARDRSQREIAISRSVQEYADTLEREVRNHPFQWYHFDPFLKPQVAKADADRSPKKV